MHEHQTNTCVQQCLQNNIEVLIIKITFDEIFKQKRFWCQYNNFFVFFQSVKTDFKAKETTKKQGNIVSKTANK